MTGARAERHIGIVGTGIVGVAAAFHLTTLGYRVTIYDRALPGEGGPSRGNAGHIAASDIFPLSEPGILLSGLAMLRRPDAPLKVASHYFPRLLPWLLQFRRAGLGQARERAIQAMSILGDGAVRSTELLFAQAGIPHMVRRVPALYVYDRDRSLRASQGEWNRKADAGHASSPISRAEIVGLEPALAPIFEAGILSHHWAIVSDPLEVVRGLFAAATKAGTEFCRESVTGLERGRDGVRVVTKGQGYRHDEVIITAGVWSRTFAAALGEKLPVEAEGGYNITYPAARGAITHPIVFAERGVVATDLVGGLRIGGWAEFAGPEAAAQPSYFNRLERIARELFPNLDERGGVRWSGRRPSMPDSVPVISPSIRDPRILYATGHGHYGLTWAAQTARLLEELLAGDSSRAAPFSIARFN